METLTFQFNGHQATVIRPDYPNGKWIWKTEFLYAFDEAERKLCEMGYTRVYYSVSNKFGSFDAVRKLHNFYRYLIKEFDLSERCILFGFSRGGLYAFNYAPTYPETVEKIYLDAPVLDMRTWPPKGSRDREMLYEEFGLTEETLEWYKGHPIDNMEEFFALNIPLLLVAGDADEAVPFPQNAGRMIGYCKEKGIAITSFVKPGCRHHPHSLADVSPIVDFVEG